LVTNGDFEQGSTGFTTEYQNLGTNQGSTCSYRSQSPTENQILVANSPSICHTGYEAETTRGRLLIINSAGTSKNFWCQTVAVRPNKTYALEVDVRSAVTIVNQANRIQWTVNGVAISTLTQTERAFRRYTYPWSSGSATSATVCGKTIDTSRETLDTVVDNIKFSLAGDSCGSGAITQCNDSIDNDGDGLVDTVVELNSANGETIQVGGTGDPSVVTNAVIQAMARKRFPSRAPTTAGELLRSTGGSGGGNRWNDNGTLDLVTLDKVCEVLGFDTYVSSTCLDNERSRRYPFGKCNYHTPSNNLLARFTTGGFTYSGAAPKYGNTWIASITCRNRLAACRDGWDNDGDGAIDLADTGCASPNDDDERGHDPGCSSPSDNTEAEQCRDGLDNDSDGVSDAQDPGCWSNPADPASYNPNRPDESVATTQCQDSLDNDADGATDFGVDFSCASRQDNDETNPKSQCQDGADNDNDGAVDLADFACSGKQDNSESDVNSQCQDGADNDNDGAVDLADFACSGKQDNSESDVNSQCQDGADNDNDGAVDLADFSCSDKQDNDEMNPKSQCQDGIDNDNDGAIDLADFGCSGKQDNSESDANSQCQDGIDNDNDGAIDLADFSCSSPQDNDETNPKSQCQDGIDNDSDGAIDMTDFSCSSKQDNDEANPKSQCQDGIDNDADGAIDRADFSCSSNQDNDESDPKSSCQDGLDNDNDGAVDTNDPGCSNQQDNNEGDEPSLLEIGVECVSNNQDGTFTAYFGYENLANRELVVVSNSSAGTVNEFSPGAPSRGQTTTFQTGRRRGAVLVTFDGSPLTWKVRALGGRVSTATASLASTPCARVNPIAECINGSASGLVATFGYNNPNGFDVVIPVGLLNNVSPAPANRGQPTVLKAGRNAASFTAEFTRTATWNLDGAAASVNESTPVCEGGCIDKPIGTIKNELNQTALDLATLTKRAAKLLAQRAKTKASKGEISTAMASRAGVDAKRAAKKADELARRAQSLTVGFPEVIKACPFSAPFCQSVDRGAAIDQLRGLFVEQLNQLRRIMARRNFNQTGNTSREDPLVLEARRVKAQGDAQLSEVPRVATECE
jgi:hypothetical protein